MNSTALHEAIVSKDVETAQFLIENGVALDYKDYRGKTLLHLAIYRKLPSIAKLLIEKGIDINQDLFLNIAASHGMADIVNCLIAKGFDINQPFKDGRTPLYLASAGTSDEHLEIVEMLIKSGADVNCQTKEGKTALHAASKVEDSEKFQLLLAAGADPNHADKDGRTPLYLASAEISDKHLEIVEMLINSGADVNCQTKEGKTALHVASKRGRSDISRLLLAAGADPNHADKDGRTPLYLASSETESDIEYFKIVEMLIKSGANVHYQTKEGETALHAASGAWEGANIGQLLLATGADPNHADSDGDTPLHLAVSQDNEKLVALLLTHGADARQLSREGSTALETLVDRIENFKRYFYSTERNECFYEYTDEKIILMLLLAEGNILEPIELPKRCLRIEKFLSNLAFNQQLKESIPAARLINSMLVLPFEFHIRQFQLRQDLLSFFTKGNKEIHVLCKIIALQHHSPEYQRDLCSPKYMYSPWFVLLKSFVRFEQYAALKPHLLNAYDLLSKPLQLSTLNSTQLVEAKKMFEEEMLELNYTSLTKERFPVIFKGLLKLPDALHNIIFEETTLNRVHDKYHTEIHHSHKEDAHRFFKEYQKNMHGLHEGYFEMTKYRI